MAHVSIFGYYGQGNAGDEAILAALIDGIKNHTPNASISVYSANPAETSATHKVASYNHFSFDFKQIIKGILGGARASYIRSAINFLRTDVVIIGGGGLFFDSKETNKWIYGYLKLIHRAKALKKKVALMGISIGPLHHRESEQAVGEAFAKADLISVRDASSKNLLIKCGIAPEKIHVIADLVFTLHSAPAERIETILAQEHFINNDKCNVALTPCCYNTEHEGWLSQYVAICERIVSELDSNLWLVPMQRSNHHDDLSAINLILGRLSHTARERVCVLQGIYNAKEVQGVLSMASVVLAERLHGSIMALNTHTPVMSIAYMPKVTGVLELANLQDNLIDYGSFLSGNSQQQIIETLRRYESDKTLFIAAPASDSTAAVNNFIKLHALLSK